MLNHNIDFVLTPIDTIEGTQISIMVDQKTPNYKSNNKSYVITRRNSRLLTLQIHGNKLNLLGKLSLQTIGEDQRSPNPATFIKNYKRT